ncbi:S-adenosylmethionine-dependent methyltransferase [Vallitalea longa]|uniref:S-adenosylmethionine-dependent methyltransferase n=1 Tax=Vallitalea longa TaxID=2936439 RepID=A0A9W5YE08_9FIRM|nr:class I SAM-dependent methyltransferase [Vallitalea longa]GKX29488.1 S-adenosylmethionine-dependent methyltransferase [Vallitalea longa]
MHNLINAFPLYNFLKYCNASSLEKVVLDCGAGGSNPPLSLFHEFGYETYGIEICKEQLKKVNEFCNSKSIDLNIIEGDMTNIHFKNEFFSFLYSYNTSVHMRKVDFSVALAEFYRVLKHGGLCYVNFLSEDCDTFDKGVQIAHGEFRNIENGEEVIYCHYKDEEVKKIFHGFDIIYNEKRIIRRKINEREEYKSAYLDYILLKK